MLVNVYRAPQRDWRGQSVGDIKTHLLGQLDGIVLGGESPQPVRDFPGVVSTEGLMGIPRVQESGIVVRQGDRIEIITGSVVPLSLPAPLQLDGSWWAVTGPRQWDYPSFTGWLPPFYWVPIESTSA